MPICNFCGEEFKAKYHTVKYCNKCRHRYDDFLHDKVREGSYSSYFSHLIKLEKWLIEHGKNFDTAEKKDIERFIKEMMRAGAEASSINTFISVIQSYADWVITNSKAKWIKEGGLENMYIQLERWEKIASIKRPVIEDTVAEGAFLTIEQLKKLLDIADEKDYLLIWLLAWSGMRPGELRYASRKGKIMTIQTEKTRERKMKRRIGLDDYTVNIYEQARKNKLLKMSVRNIELRLASYSEEMKIRIMPKMLRHTFATYMDKRLIGDEEIREKFGITLDDKFTKIWMGHKVRGMKDITQIYKEYPDELIIYVAEKKHYMIPLEEER